MVVPKALLSSEDASRETPRWLYHVLDVEFGFDVDACATKENAKAPLFITPEMDALSIGWNLNWQHEEWASIFCNPPWGFRYREDKSRREDLYDYVAKGYLEAERGNIVVMHLPSKTETKWFQEFAFKATECRFYDRRIHHETNGKLPLLPKKKPDDPDKVAGATLPCLLLVFRPTAGVTGPVRFTKMCGNPKAYGPEVEELWRQSRPMRSSLTM